MKLLDILVLDEKKINRQLYSSGPYWNYKNAKTLIEIKKKGLENFRGISSGVGTSFTDNLTLDVRNELGKKGRLIANLLSLPFLKKIFNYQVIQTKHYIQDYLDAISILYSKDHVVKKLISKYKFEKTTEFGCVKKFNYNDKSYSTFYLDIANRIDNLSSRFDFLKIHSFFEIGGGFGANLHFLITNFPNIKKFIYLDTVPNIFVGTEYLRYHFKDNIVDYLQTRELKTIEFRKDNELEIICIPPWEIEKLSVKVDHFHNAASFVEMPKEVIKNYCKYFKKFEFKEISLISYDEFDADTTFDPEKLNEFFDQKLNIFRQSWLIEDYKRKLIYLCSK